MGRRKIFRTNEDVVYCQWILLGVLGNIPMLLYIIGFPNIIDINLIHHYSRYHLFRSTNLTMIRVYNKYPGVYVTVRIAPWAIFVLSVGLAQDRVYLVF